MQYAGLDGVAEVHDVHIARLITTRNVLAVHLACPKADESVAGYGSLLLRERFGIDHG